MFNSQTLPSSGSNVSGAVSTSGSLALICFMIPEVKNPALETLLSRFEISDNTVCFERSFTLLLIYCNMSISFKSLAFPYLSLNARQCLTSAKSSSLIFNWSTSLTLFPSTTYSIQGTWDIPCCGMKGLFLSSVSTFCLVIWWGVVDALAVVFQNKIVPALIFNGMTQSTRF